MQERPTVPDEREKLVAITQEEHEAVEKQGKCPRYGSFAICKPVLQKRGDAQTNA